MGYGEVIYWLGAIADWYTTKRILDRGGKELNGFVRTLIDKLPFDTELELFLIKLAGYYFLRLVEVPQWWFAGLGVVFSLAAMGNREGWWKRFAR